MIIKTGRTSSLGDRKQHCRKAPSFKLISKGLRKYSKNMQSKSLNFLVFIYIYSLTRYEEDDSSEDEGIPDYKIGGYHPVHIGYVNILNHYTHILVNFCTLAT